MTISEKIFFDTDKLTEGRTAKLVYTGSLVEGGATEVYVHFGFGLLWDNLQEIKLDKVGDSYETEITMSSCEDINFCFRDENNNWDNNNAQNYTAPVSKEEVTIAKVDSTAIQVPRLKRSYFVMKKLKIAFYRTVTFLSKTFTGEWKKKKANNA